MIESTANAPIPRTGGGPVRWRLAETQDAGAMSEVVHRALWLVNSRDYPPEELRKMAERAAPEALARSLRSAYTLVACIRGRVVGTGTLDGAQIRRLYLEPALQGRGIGSLLLAALEAEAARRGLELLTLNSSLTAIRFYARRGYEARSREYHDPGGWSELMEKRLPR